MTNATTRGYGDESRARLLGLGLGSAVAAWAVGYVCRIPPAWAPSWLLLVLLVAVLVGGGWLAARRGAMRARGGMAVGAIASLVNLLVLGSVLGGGGAAALLAIPGSVLAGALLAGAGAAIGARGAADGAQGPNAAAGMRGASATGKSRGAGAEAIEPGTWTGPLAGVVAAATLLLVAAGGLVTSQAAGLAVPDWPNSFGTNMILYPLSRMTGGIYYEHAHRLFGTLVGLCTLVLALHLQFSRASRALKGLGWIALAAVVVQGILGGLRVTGGFTTSLDSAKLAPSTALAAVHGVFGQFFFAFMLAVAVLAGRAWRSGQAMPASPAAVTDKQLAPLLVGLLIAQLAAGAALRHYGWGLHLHITVAVLVALLGGAVGARAMGLYKRHAVMRRNGRLLSWLLIVQILLGIGALVAGGGAREPVALPAIGVLLTTAHQVTGALLLGTAMVHALWSRRLKAQEGTTEPAVGR